MTIDSTTVPAPTARELREHRGLFLFSAIVAVVVGLVAIIVPHVATLAAELFVGALLAVGGIITAVTAFRARGAAGIAGSVLVGLLALAAGVLLLLDPITGAVTLTLFLTAYFFVSGVLRIYHAVRNRSAGHWPWLMGSGVLSLVLAVVLWLALPQAAFWALGLIVGVDLLFYGFMLLSAVWAAQPMAPADST